MGYEMRKTLPIVAGMALIATALPANAASLLDYIGQCVPFARAASGSRCG